MGWREVEEGEREDEEEEVLGEGRNGGRWTWQVAHSQ